MKAKGLDKILKNLNKEIRGIKGSTQHGLTRAALLVKSRALKQTPIDTGNLRASAYVIDGSSGKQAPLSKMISESLRQKMTMRGYEYTGGEPPNIQEITASGDPWAVIGYTASYAAYVHEINPEGGYKAPNTNWKFLEFAISDSRRDILNIIKKTAKV